MHVLCFGAGAIGSLVGARLSAAGVAVTLLARRDHVAAVRTWGLILEAPGERLVCKRLDSVTAVEDLASPPDLVVLTVKAYQTAEALAALAPALPPGAAVLCLQNGVGSEELVAAAIGAPRTVAGSITISAERPRPGVVRQQSRVGGVGVAPVAPGGDVSAWVRMFRDAGIPAASYRDFREMKWSKLLINLFTNATSAILDVAPSAVVDDPRLFALERRALREALAVLRGLGLRPTSLPDYPVPVLPLLAAAPPAFVRPLLRRLIRRGRGDARTSLWRDLARGRRESEVSALNGAVAREAARLGIPAPVNAALTEVLTAIASGRRDAAEFRGRPEALLQAVGARAGAPSEAAGDRVL
jgi:2-dehydropantoate 2-reductase